MDYPSHLLLAKSFGVTDGIFIVAIVLLVMLSAFFSASETAFSSVNTLHIKSFAEQKVKGARRAQYICDHYDFALVCFLVGNNLVNIANTTICAYLFTRFIVNPTIANLLNTVIMTIVILIFGEILPKGYAKHNPEKFVLKFSAAIYIFTKIVYVIAMPFYGLQKVVLKRKEEHRITEDEFETIVDALENQGTIDREKANIIHGAIDISEKTVYDICVPRVDMIALPINATIDEIKDNHKEHKFSRVPIYEQDKDDIIGILNYKDLLFSDYEKSNFNLKKILTEPLRVTDTMKVDDLIKLMQKEQKHMAIVVDEFGGTAGLVTMEDALELIFGEIYDEHDKSEGEQIIKLAEDKYSVDPDISVEDLFEYLEIEHLPETSYSSVGGMVYELLESVPAKGKTVNITAIDEVLNEKNNYVEMIADLSFTIDKVQDNRIVRLSLKVSRSQKESQDKED